jgi:hypothetical protein
VGDTEAAIDIALIPLRLTKRPPQSYLTTHAISVAVAAMASKALNTIAEQTSDTAALRRGLDLITELQPTVFPGEIENWRYSNSLGALRFAAANGYPVSLEPQPLVNYYEQSGTKLGQFYSLWIVKNFPADDARAQRSMAHLFHYQNPFDIGEAFAVDEDENPIENLANYMETWEEHLQNQTLDLNAVPSPPDIDSLSYKVNMKAFQLLFGMPYYTKAYADDIPNIEDILTRAKVSFSLYELTRQNFAKRLVSLESPDKASSALKPTAEQLTVYLSHLPDDPFRAAPFLYSDKLNLHYSVGPDKQDNKTEIIYDSTNGVVSPGDFWMQLYR